MPVGDGGQEAYTPTYDDEEYEYGAFEVEEDDEYPVSESQVGSLRLGEHDASTLSAALETRFNKPYVKCLDLLLVIDGFFLLMIDDWYWE